jgi:hypothetical protein
VETLWDQLAREKGVKFGLRVFGQVGCDSLKHRKLIWTMDQYDTCQRDVSFVDLGDLSCYPLVRERFSYLDEWHGLRHTTLLDFTFDAAI